MSRPLEQAQVSAGYIKQPLVRPTEAPFSRWRPDISFASSMLSIFFLVSANRAMAVPFPSLLNFTAMARIRLRFASPRSGYDQTLVRSLHSAPLCRQSVSRFPFEAAISTLNPNAL